MTGRYGVYDAAWQITWLDSPTVRRCDFSYDPAGNLAKKRLGNGVTAYYTYDAAERLARIRRFKAGGDGVA